MSEAGQADPHAGLQRRTLALLSITQVLSGLGIGAVVTVGALLAADLAGTAWAGSITTVMTLGTAMGAMPLARLAMARGRRVSLSVGMTLSVIGAVCAIAAASWSSFPLLLLAGVLIGGGGAVNLQARFAATDLSHPKSRGRDLSLVVWMTMVGSVAGPNLLGVGAVVAGWFGVPPLSGIFIISATGMLMALTVLLIGMRPDPYLVAQASSAPDDRSPAQPSRGSLRSSLAEIASRPAAAGGLLAIVTAHAVMVSVMSMTSVHLAGHGASITLIGLTISLHIAGMYGLAPVMGILTDRLGAPVVIWMGMVILLLAVGLAGFGAAHHLSVTTGLVLLGLGWSAATVAGSVLIVDGVPAASRLGAQGSSDTLMSLAGALGGGVSGVILSATGYLGLNLVAAGIVVGASVVLLGLLNRSRGRGRATA